MKKIFDKIGQVLQMVLAAPVKLPGKVGNILKYLAVGLGILEAVLDDAEPPPKDSRKSADRDISDGAERREANEVE